MSKLRLEQLETLDASVTVDVAEILTASDNVPTTTPTVSDLLAMDTGTLQGGESVIVSGTTFLYNQGTDSWEPRGAVHVASFGADVTGSLDSQAILSQAADTCRDNGWGLRADPSDRLLILDQVDFRKIFVDIKGTILPDFYDKPQVLLGNSSQDGAGPDQYIYEVAPINPPGYGEAGPVPSVRVLGSKGQAIRVSRAFWVELYADVTQNALEESSCAYSTYTLAYVNKVSLQSNMSYGGSDLQWITENKFHLDRTFTFYIEGTYPHNHNRIYGGTFEGSNSEIEIVNGSNNRFYDIRFEAGGGCIFGPLSHDNSVEYTWTSSNPIRSSDAIKSLAGIRNRVVDTENKYTTPSCLFRATKNTAGYQFGVGPHTSSGERVVFAAGATVYESDLIPLTRETRISYKAEGKGSGTGLRARIEGYSSSGVLMTASTFDDYNVIGAGSHTFGDLAQPRTDTNAGGVITFNNSAVSQASYVKLILTAGGAGLTAVSVGAWVENPSYWGDATNSDVVTMMGSIAGGQGRKARASIPSDTYAAHASVSFTRSWPGLPANTVISISEGSETAIPDGFILQARCTSTGVVTVQINNATAASATMPGGAWAHLCAHTGATDEGAVT